MSFGQINRVGDPIPFEADPNLPVMPAIPRGRTNCGDIDMRIAVDGTWFHEGTPIGRRELVKLFAKVLTRDKAGRFWLVTPAEMARIQVEDAPFLAVEMTVSGSGRDQVLAFRTNVDETVIADKDHPIRLDTDPVTGEPSPYVAVRPRMDARLVRSVYYDLVSQGTEEKQNNESVFGIWSSGVFFPIGSLDDDGEETESGP